MLSVFGVQRKQLKFLSANVIFLSVLKVAMSGWIDEDPGLSTDMIVEKAELGHAIYMLDDNKACSVDRFPVS